MTDILGIEPTFADLEIAVVYAQGEGDVAAEEGHSLSGKSAQIYEVLSNDDVYRTEDL